MLFTERQVDLVQKYVEQQKLTPSEQAYFYSTVRRKMEALKLIREEYYIIGKEMIPERVKEAKQILKKIPLKAFISGSFLYNLESQDIDIFIIGKQRKQQHDGKQHITYIAETDLQQPLFVSAANYSVANFSLTIKPLIKREQFGELLLVYQLAINEIIDNDDQKTVRRMIFEYNVQAKKTILDSFSLYQEFCRIKQKKTKEKKEIVNQMFKDMLLQLYSKRYLYAKLGPFIKNLKETAQEYPKANEGILIYINLLTEVKHECRRN